MTIDEYRAQLLKQHTVLVPDPAQEGWLDDENVDALAAAYRAGDDIPPIIAVRLRSGDLQIFEGHHRYEASKIAGVIPDVIVIPLAWAERELHYLSREEIEYSAKQRFERLVQLTYQRRKGVA